METVIQNPPPEPPPPASPPPAPAPSGPKNNTMAITSLSTGIAGLVMLCATLIPFVSLICGCLSLLLAIAALVTGFMARSQIQTSGEGGGGMAMAGIILGGVQLVLLLCGALIGVIILMGPAVGNVFSSINASLK